MPHQSPLTFALLGLSLVALALGPAIHFGARARRATLAGLDGFILVAIAGLVLLHVVPEALTVAGWPAAVAVILGLTGPSITERLLARVAHQAHTAALALALVGLAIHAAFDGVALTGWQEHQQAERTMLAAAVVLHRLPVGLTVWMLLRPRFGVRLPLGVLIGLGVATVVGFFLGDALAALAESEGLAILQAFVAGSLLHVVLHRGHEYGPEEGAGDPENRRGRLLAGVGALAAVALVALLSYGLGHEAHGHGGHDHGGHGLEPGSFGATFLALAFESAPALVIGYAAAGAVSVLLPRASLAWLRRGSSLTQAVRGVVFGLPLPICSCGVVPLYRSLVQRGAPAAAAMAFLVATPELGLDAVLLSLPLLGVPLTVARVVAAGVIALLVGWWVGRLIAKPKLPPPEDVAATTAATGLGARLRTAVANGFGETFEATAPWILAGLAVAAVAAPLLADGWLRALPGWLEVPLFAALGMPMYICASGATPLVAVLVFQGVSPGAAIAFLLTGPATNVTTFGLLRELHGARVALAFGGVIAALSIGLGYVANAFLPFTVPFSPEAAEHGPTVIQAVSLGVLGLALLVALLRVGPRQLIEVVVPPPKHEHDHDHDHDDGGGEGDACCSGETCCGGS